MLTTHADTEWSRVQKQLSTTCHSITNFFFHGASAPRGLGPPHYRGFTITFS